MKTHTGNGPHHTRRDMLSIVGGLGAMALIRPDRAVAQTTKPPEKPTGQVIIGFSQEPTVFNPLMPGIEVDQGVHWNLFSPLWGAGPDGQLVPYLAAEVPSLANGGISDDGLRWRIKLRSDVMWHDGKPFSAEDVKFTIDLINNPQFRAGIRSGHELVRDITIHGPTEISWRIERAFAPYMSILATTFIVPRHVLEAAADPNMAAFNNAPVGTGPFKWGSRLAGDNIILAANEDYFGEGPHLERLIFKYIPDLTVLFTQFQTGDIDYIGLQGISPDRYEDATKLVDRTIVPAPMPSVENLGFNLGRPQFKDRAVREALYLAVDKKSIIETIYYGLPQPTESFLPLQSWAYNADLPRHEFDPDKAKALLDEAGWRPGADGIREKDGVRLSFTNSTTAGNHVREQTQQFLQQTWRDIGAELKINNLPAAVMWGDFFRLSEFETVMVGTSFVIGSDPESRENFSSRAIPVTGGSGWNTMQYSNPEVDRLLDEGGASADPAKRREIYVKMQGIIRQDLPFLPFFQYALVEGTKKDLVGLKPNVNLLSNAWNAGNWYWAKS